MRKMFLIVIMAAVAVLFGTDTSEASNCKFTLAKVAVASILGPDCARVGNPQAVNVAKLAASQHGCTLQEVCPALVQDIVANKGAPIPVYLPYGGERFFGFTTLEQFKALEAFLTRANKRSEERKSETTDENRQDDMQVLADGFLAGNRFVGKLAKELNDQLALDLIQVNDAFKRRGCVWTNGKAATKAVVGKVKDSKAKAKAKDAEKAKAEAVKTAEGKLKAVNADIAKLDTESKPWNEKLAKLDKIPTQNRGKYHRSVRGPVEKALAELNAKRAQLLLNKGKAEEDLKVAKGNTKAAEGKLAASTEKVKSEIEKVRLDCKGADMKDLATLKEFNKSKEIPQSESDAVMPWIVRGNAAKTPDMRLYAVWGGLGRYALKRRMNLTTTPKDVFADNGSLKKGTVGNGDRVIGPTIKGYAKGKWNASKGCIEGPDGSCLESHSPVSTNDGIIGYGFRLNLRTMFAAGDFGAESHMAGNGLGAITLGLSYRWQLASWFTLEPLFGAGYTYVNGESSLRTKFDAPPNRHAPLITGGAKFVFHLSDNWSLYQVNEAFFRPGWGGSFGIGGETSIIPATILSLDVRYMFLPDTGISAGNRWGTSVGNVGINGVGATLTASF